MTTTLVFMLVLEVVSSFAWSPPSSALAQCARIGEPSMRRNLRRKISNSRPCRSTARRQELTCGLQVTVRIRGKKSREDDYTNQVAAVFISLCCRLGRHPAWNMPYSHSFFLFSAHSQHDHEQPNDASAWRQTSCTRT